MVPTALLSGSACWFLLLAFLLFAPCFLLSLASAFCLLLLASCFLLSVSCSCFLLFAFCFYVFWTESKNGCNKTIAITTATITVTLTKDSHYSLFFKNSFFLLLILLRVLLLRVVFLLLMNEHQETTNEHRKEKKTNEHQEKNQRINAAICSIRERTRLQLV